MIHSGPDGAVGDLARGRGPAQLRPMPPHLVAGPMPAGAAAARGALAGAAPATHPVFARGPDGRLAAGGMPIEAALAEAGASTPAYVYCLEAVLAAYDGFAGALDRRRRAGVFAALKANALPALVRPLVERGAGVEAVSAAELLVAEGMGIPGERIVMSGVGKTAGDIDTAVEVGVRFLSVESEGELGLLDARARRAGRTMSALLRLNPALSPVTHPKIATGAATAKFGMAEDDLVALAERRAEWPAVRICGVHAHIGSQIRDLGVLRENALCLARVYRRLHAAGAPVSVVDVGGGLGIPHHDGEAAIAPARYVGAMREVVAGALGDLDPELVFEPGRSLFGAAGTLVVGVLHTKRIADRDFCVVDGGMNDFLRPAMYGATHRIQPVAPRPGRERRFDVVGGVCETGDAFGRGVPLPPVASGDLLAILDAGAYGYSMASNVNLRPRPAEVVVANGSALLGRPAETPEILAARELGAG